MYISVQDRLVQEITELMYYNIPCTYMRGGTSRALIFQKKDLPEDKKIWPEFFMKALGVRMTVAGLSAMGVDFPTHKIAVISPHEGEDADVDYDFFQTDDENYYVDNRGNCGNMSSAVGPYAIDEGMVEVKEPETIVRIFNTNTKRIIRSRVLVKNGKSSIEGDTRIHGVPGTGSPIELTFENPGGGLTGKLFPTGNKQDILDVPGYGKLPVTLIDCANPVVIFKAEDAGLNGTETCIGACSVFIMLQKYLLLCWEGVRECFRSTPHQAQ